MATQRTAQELGEFVKLDHIGAAVFGFVSRQGENSNGRYVVFEPAGYRSRDGEKFEKYGELACGLRTDLASKVSTTDTGKLLLFVLVATKPTAKSPMKIFNVFEIEPSEARDLIAGKPFPAEWMTVPESAVASTAAKPAHLALF